MTRKLPSWGLNLDSKARACYPGLFHKSWPSQHRHVIRDSSGFPTSFGQEVVHGLGFDYSLLSLVHQSLAVRGFQRLQGDSGSVLAVTGVSYATLTPRKDELRRTVFDANPLEHARPLRQSRHRKATSLATLKACLCAAPPVWPPSPTDCGLSCSTPFTSSLSPEKLQSSQTAMELCRAPQGPEYRAEPTKTAGSTC